MEPRRSLQDIQTGFVFHIVDQLTQLATLKTEQSSREPPAAARTQVLDVAARTWGCGEIVGPPSGPYHVLCALWGMIGR